MVRFEYNNNDCFSIEASNDRYTENPGFQGYTDTLDEALTCADQQKTKFRYVWLSEWGHYGNDKQAWIYFWWTEGAYNEVPEGRRRGYLGKGSGIPSFFLLRFQWDKEPVAQSPSGTCFGAFRC